MAEGARPVGVAAGGRRWVSAWLPVLVLEALVLFLSSRSHVPLPRTIPYLDKAAHFVEYALLGWLLRRAFVMTLRHDRGATAAAIVLAAVLGAGDELFQSTVAGRDSSPWDWLADSWGAIVGVALAWWTARSRARVAVTLDEAEGTKG